MTDAPLKPCLRCGKVDYFFKGRTITIKCSCPIKYEQKYSRMTREQLLELMVVRWNNWNTRPAPDCLRALDVREAGEIIRKTWFSGDALTLRVSEMLLSEAVNKLANAIVARFGAPSVPSVEEMEDFFFNLASIPKHHIIEKPNNTVAFSRAFCHSLALSCAALVAVRSTRKTKGK